MRPSYSILLIVLLIPFVASCTEKRGEVKDNWKDMVSTTARSKWGNADGVYLDLRETPFVWDKVYFFPPYTLISTIDDALGFRWSGARKTGINERDGINLVVFVRKKKVVAHIEHPRVEGDFSRLDANNGITPEEAFFEVREELAGGPWLYFYQVPREDHDD